MQKTPTPLGCPVHHKAVIHFEQSQVPGSTGPHTICQQTRCLPCVVQAPTRMHFLSLWNTTQIKEFNFLNKMWSYNAYEVTIWILSSFSYRIETMTHKTKSKEKWLYSSWHSASHLLFNPVFHKAYTLAPWNQGLLLLKHACWLCLHFSFICNILPARENIDL